MVLSDMATNMLNLESDTSNMLKIGGRKAKKDKKLYRIYNKPSSVRFYNE